MSGKMTQFRLHIDIPLGGDEQDAIDIAEHVMERIKDEFGGTIIGSVDQINYRLGHDEDRQKSNYLMKTPEGHITKKKCRISLTLGD